MQEPEVDSQYTLPIGSQKRALARLLALLTLWIAMLGLLYHVLAEYTGDFVLFLFVMIVILTVMRRAMSPAWQGWALYFMKDGAYGSIKEGGIEYRTVFRKKNFVRWSQINQSDYSPSDGRVRIYLYNKTLPIQFGRCAEENESNTHEFAFLHFLKEKIQSSGGSFVELPSLPWWDVRVR
ncbi:MAG: hypothetical protein JWQ87_5052 [Candidatus Sulfotelmatobacter sp.]|nr:hypothetical protein [Candidatus Sulfotelmatobacter sp.]